MVNFIYVQSFFYWALGQSSVLQQSNFPLCVCFGSLSRLKTQNVGLKDNSILLVYLCARLWWYYPYACIFIHFGKKIDSAYHAALRFVTNAGPRTHHWTLYNSFGWPAINLGRKMQMLLFLFVSGKCPTYISSPLSCHTGQNDGRSTVNFF